MTIDPCVRVECNPALLETRCGFYFKTMKHLDTMSCKPCFFRVHPAIMNPIKRVKIERNLDTFRDSERIQLNL